MTKNNEDWVFYVKSLSIPVERNGSISAEIQFNPNSKKAVQISNDSILDYLNTLGGNDGSYTHSTVEKAHE